MHPDAVLRCRHNGSSPYLYHTTTMTPLSGFGTDFRPRHLTLEDETWQLLLQMSPPTIGRLLAGERTRYRLHGICHTRSTPLGGRIPIQTCMDPPLSIPGVLAVDLVGHDGGQAVGDFGWTLTVTDCTTW
ncbi:MAG: hypothetical protein C0398_03675 [Coprothermobacter sp.]|jgi:hypothetical protein|nr:hypothetical protein [Coprothermobacter sp.]